MEPLKIFLLQSIFCISCHRYYNDSVHLLKIYEFRLLLVITNSHYTQVVINMSDVQLKSLFFLTSLGLCGLRIIEFGHWGSVCAAGRCPVSATTQLMLLGHVPCQGEMCPRPERCCCEAQERQKDAKGQVWAQPGGVRGQGHPLQQWGL